MSCRSKKQLTQQTLRAETKLEKNLNCDSMTQERLSQRMQTLSIVADSLKWNWIDFDTSQPCDTVTGMPPVKRIGTLSAGRRQQTTVVASTNQSQTTQVNKTEQQAARQKVVQKQIDKTVAKTPYNSLPDFATVAFIFLLTMFLVRVYRKFIKPKILKDYGNKEN